MKYFLHKYGTPYDKALKTFTSRRSLCTYMRKLGIPASEIADGYFLHVLGPRCSVVYDFVACGSDLSHLQAVSCRSISW